MRPSPGIVDLQKQITALKKQLKELRDSFEQLAKQKGPTGDTGMQGPIGPIGKTGLSLDPDKCRITKEGLLVLGFSDDSVSVLGQVRGTITVILIGEDGKEIRRQDNVKSGSEVRLNKRTFLREE